MKARFSDFVFKAGMGKFVIVSFPRKAPVGAEPTVLVPLLPSLMYHEDYGKKHSASGNMEGNGYWIRSQQF